MGPNISNLNDNKNILSNSVRRLEVIENLFFNDYSDSLALKFCNVELGTLLNYFDYISLNLKFPHLLFKFLDKIELSALGLEKLHQLYIRKQNFGRPENISCGIACITVETSTFGFVQ